jgi:tetratricopeptide (TPR) repeat protein
MKRTTLNPFFWLTVLIGCSGLLTAIPPVIGQTNSAVLLVQQSDELMGEGIPFNLLLPEQQEALQQAQQAWLKARQAWELIELEQFTEAIILLEQALPIFEKTLGSHHSLTLIAKQALRGAKLAQAAQYDAARAAFEKAISI